MTVPEISITPPALSCEEPETEVASGINTGKPPNGVQVIHSRFIPDTVSLRSYLKTVCGAGNFEVTVRLPLARLLLTTANVRELIQLRNNVFSIRTQREVSLDHLMVDRRRDRLAEL